MTNIPECISHLVHSDSDCDMCKVVIEAMVQENVRLTTQNMELERRLGHMGQMIPAHVYMSTRMEMILELIMGDNMLALGKFELAFSQRCGEMLEHALDQAAREMLTQGVNGVHIK